MHTDNKNRPAQSQKEHKAFFGNTTVEMPDEQLDEMLDLMAKIWLNVIETVPHGQNSDSRRAYLFSLWRAEYGVRRRNTIKFLLAEQKIITAPQLHQSVSYAYDTVYAEN